MNKYLSRKFIVWFTWLVLIVCMMFFGHDFDITALTPALQMFGTISIIYIGGNVAKEFIKTKETKSE